MRSPVAAAFAIGFGLVVLLGYFIPAGAGGMLGNLIILRTWIVDWAVTLAGFATLVAILGLVLTHWRKLRARRNPDRYSIFMLLFFVITVLWGVIAYGFGGDIAGFQQVVNAVQMPVEASLMAVLAVTLTMASFRLFQRRRGLLALVFAISVVIFLLLNSGILYSLDFPVINDVISIIRFLPVAGGRGILLGIALGSLLAGLRIILGAERPYSG